MDDKKNMKGIPKTGLAAAIRDWMQSRTGTKAQRRFTVTQICEALCVMTARQHQQVANALSDFQDRGEVESFTDKHNRRQYLYVQDWGKALRGHLNRKIYKAMYVSYQFAVTDLQRLTGLQDRCWLDKLVRQLKADGYIQQSSRRLCAHGSGAEAVYHIVNRDKFKLEVMR
ncbi:MAG: hypothetical protein WC436_05975 [Candidatus Babeliales bacterium]